MAKVKQQVLEPNEDVLDEISRKYVYMLAQENEARGRVFDEDGRPRPDPKYPPRRNVLLRSSIIWDGSDYQENENGVRIAGQKAGRRLIRYYDGCQSLFIDEQPKDPETIEQLVRSTRELYFINGYLEVYGYDTKLKEYLDICSWNAESKFRVRTSPAIFKMLDTEAIAAFEAAKLDMQDKAMEYAKTAKESHMRVHAKFLGIPEVDLRTGQKLSEKALRTEYRKAAIADAKRFTESYNDKTIHIKAWIEKAMDSGEISTTILANKAVWAKKGAEICDISGIKSKEGILNKLIEFSQLEEGAEFVEMLKALYD